MRFTRKSGLQRALETIDSSLEAANEARPVLRQLGSLTPGKSTGHRLLDTVGHALPSRTAMPKLTSSKAGKAGLIAAGSLAGLTAGSVGISSLRRRSEGPRDDS